jgi:uncharacterized protein
MPVAATGRTGVRFSVAKRLLLWATLLVLLTYIGACAYMWETQRQHIFEPAAQLQTTPDRVGMEFEEVHIPVGSGSDRGELYGWWIPAQRHNAPTFLYLHGNDYNIGHGSDLDKAGQFHRLGYNVLTFDYRGYGRSTGGEPSEAKVYEDAEAAWKYLIEKRACPPRRTFIFGHSLGGAIAINLALHHPEAAGLISESTFTTMNDIAGLHYEYMPVALLLNQRFDSLGKIDRLKIPVLFIHGTWDKYVPYRMSEELYKRAPQPKFIKLIEGGEHNNDGNIGWVDYRDAIQAFVRKFAH